MSFQAMAKSIGAEIRDPLAKCLLVMMANYADENGKCWPSQERLVDDTGMSIRSVRRKTEWLMQAGYLTVLQKRRGRSTVNIYTIHPAPVTVSNDIHPATVAPSNTFTRPHSPFHPATVAAEPIIEPITVDVVSASARTDYRKLEHELRQAAGLENSPAPMLADLSPIIGLQKGGADFDTEILPAIRVRPNSKARTWGYFVPQIQQYRANLEAAAESPMPQARAGPVGAKQGSMLAAIARKRAGQRQNHEPDSDVLELSAVAGHN